MGILLFVLSTIIFAEEKVFVACEGNFYQSNGSVWTITENEAFPYLDNPLGEIVQSLYVDNDKLYVIVNGSGNIQVFDITENNLVPLHFIDTQSSGPREMIIIDNYLYFTNWYSADVKKIDLLTWEIVAAINMPGLPEDIMFNNGTIYVSIIMNLDWTDSDKVVSILPHNDEILEIYTVGSGPGDLTMHNNDIYIARTFYDDNWHAYYGTSKINSEGEITIVDYGVGFACGGSVHSYQGSVYRTFNGGIAKLDDDLQVIPETRIGNFNSNEVYAVEVIDDNIYFGLSDFVAPDQVVILDANGNEISSYDVGALPGDFAIWNSCVNNGDVNEDNAINIADIIIIIDNVLDNSPFICNADINNDAIVNIIDVVLLVQNILNNR